MMVFLTRMEVLAAREPCLVPKADMLRLVEMAGFNRTHLAWAQIKVADDPVLALRQGVLQLIEMARE